MKIQKGNPYIYGVDKTEAGYNFTMKSTSERITLMLYKCGLEETKYEINLDKTYKTGDLFSVLISEVDLSEFLYCYIDKDITVNDPYSKAVTGCGEFGEINSTNILSFVELQEFDWGKDKQPEIPYDEAIVYKLHVRGFTKSKTSHVKNPGTFKGIIEKIPYLKTLGITTLELMPAYEFEEIERFSHSTEINKYTVDMKKPLNYWGYTTGLNFAPKASYSSIKNGDYTVEFKEMVKELHSNGVEVIMEMYFDTTDGRLIDECVRYWIKEYHIDGVHLYGPESALNIVAHDAVLSHTKIFTIAWNSPKDDTEVKHMANYNDEFSTVCKKFLKGDENQLSTFIGKVKANPDNSAVINYITNNNGFTMVDLVSYDRKHNEDNGEDNRDGIDCNNSWNCGVEGTTKRKKILELRKQQIKNSFLMLLLSQGTPLIYAGDEFMNSQNGNNNPYCLDNEVSWVNWNVNKDAREILEFVTAAIRLRKENGILHLPVEMSASDTLSCGYPDVSYHSENAWVSGLASYDRHIGIMYCTSYDKKKRVAPDFELLYIAYNMHWEPHEIALPRTENREEWEVILESNPNGGNKLIDDKKVLLMPRSIVCLKAKCKTITKKKTKRKNVNERV